MILQATSCIGVGLAIGFIYSWKYTLFILGIVPIMLTAVAIQIKLAKGFSGNNNKELEQAGKVENIKYLFAPVPRFFCFFLFFFLLFLLLLLSLFFLFFSPSSGSLPSCRFKHLMSDDSSLCMDVPLPVCSTRL